MIVDVKKYDPSENVSQAGSLVPLKLKSGDHFSSGNPLAHTPSLLGYETTRTKKTRICPTFSNEPENFESIRVCSQNTASSKNQEMALN